MKTAIALVLALLVPNLAGADKIQMKTGLWEMSGHVKVGGQQLPAPKIQHCVTAKDLATAWWQQLPPGMDCKADQRVTGSRVTWTLDCKMNGGGAMTMAGKIDYTKTKFSGGATMKMTVPNAGTQTGTMTMAGKYLGACKR